MKDNNYPKRIVRLNEEAKLLRTVALWAEETQRHFRSSPGGDTFTYEGPMNCVEELKEALDAYSTWRLTNRA